MKKFLTFIFVIVLAVSLTACKKEESKKEVESGRIPYMVQAVKNALGENYLATFDVPSELFKDAYGIEEDWYNEMYVATPMIGFHPDLLIIVESKDEASLASIMEKLNERLAYVTDGSLQYPANIDKVQNAKVYNLEQYACFVLLGAPGCTFEEGAAFAEDARKALEDGLYNDVMPPKGITDIVDAIKEELKEEYIPTFNIVSDEAMIAMNTDKWTFISERYGVSDYLYSDVYIETLEFTSSRVDTLMVFKARTEFKDELLTAVNDYRTLIMNDSLYGYGTNQPTLSIVEEVEGFIIFSMLGETKEVNERAIEAARALFAK